MPSPYLGQGEAAGSGGPASSAQADTGGVFSLKFPPNVEYRTGTTTTVASRVASQTPRPMPPFVENRDNTQYMIIPGTGQRPVTKLPRTNLEKVEAPPGMNYINTYIWELASLLEGKASCYEHFPTWDPGSIHYNLSRYLGFATRHKRA